MLSNCTAPGSPASKLVDLVIQVLLAAQCSISPKEMWPEDYGPTAIENNELRPYDFIIVGAGTAGSVVASRLSENPHWRILLLEAGEDPPIESEIPYFYDTLINTPYDWHFCSEPNPNVSLALKNGAIISQGKLLGGNSGTNNMVYIRGNVEDYEYWENCGNPTWGWANVLAYFLKSEYNRYPPIASNDHCHSTNGLMPIDIYRGLDFGKDLFTSMAFDAGIEELFDGNIYKHIGILQAQGTLDRKTRSSTAKSFLLPAKKRKNLHIIKNAKVINILFNNDGSAGGVNFILKGKIMQARAKKEIILSAGAINTPKILMLSGIGPVVHLKSQKIKVRTDLPVGYNFHDHPRIPFVIRIPKTYHDLKNNIVDNTFTYFTHRDGKFGSIGVRDIFTFVNTKNESAQYPNIQIGYSYYQRGDAELYTFLENIGYEQDVVEKICQANAQNDIGILWISLLSPLSRGFIGLRSRDPLAPTLIKTNYLAELADLEVLIEGIDFVKDLLQTDSAKLYGAKEVKLHLKRCQSLKYGKRDYWECYIRNLLTSGNEPVGTTKMGPECDKESVVDWRLRVYNMKKLRIIGSSIMPRIVRAQIYATNVMIAEKGADFIKEDWKSLEDQFYNI